MDCRKCKQEALTDENGLCDFCASVIGEATPGPWKVDTLEGEPGRGVFGPNGELVADCFAATSDECGTPEDYEANAHFIAAAPAMLKELEFCAKKFDALKSPPKPRKRGIEPCA